MFEIENIFINPFYRRKLIRKIKSLSDKYDYGYGNSVSTWYNNHYLHRERCFKPLYKKILRLFPYDVVINEMWANINPPGSKTDWHTHHGWSGSGCIYLKKPKDSGNLLLGDKIIETKENNVIVFDANIPHCTELNRSNKDRVIISFNYRTD